MNKWQRRKRKRSDESFKIYQGELSEKNTLLNNKFWPIKSSKRHHNENHDNYNLIGLSN